MKDKRKNAFKFDKRSLIGIKIVKLFKPIHGRTNPLWTICAPILTKCYTRTPEFKKYTPLVMSLMETHHTSKSDIERDMAYSMIAFGVSPDDYAAFNFYHQSNDYRSNYFGSIQNYEMAWKLNDINKQDLFNDKTKQMSYFNKWYHREWTILRKEEDIPACISLLSRHPKCLLKPIDGSEGSGIQLVEKEKIKDAEAFFLSAVQKDSWILDECIQQHPFMAEIYPHSVNTIRFNTVLGKNGKVRIFYPYLRMGRGGSIVDNRSAGGLVAYIDVNTGVIIGKLVSEMRDGCRTNHPDTGCQVIGREIPQWEEAKQMLGEMARACPQSRYLGWDMALSAEHGWTVVEINSPPGLVAWNDNDNCSSAKYFKDLERWALEGYQEEVLPEGQIEV